jgi:hypothetical protein
VHLAAPVSTPLIAVPKAWTVGTNGPVRGKVVKIAKLPETEADLEQHKGKLAGAIVFAGEERKLQPLGGPLSKRCSEQKLKEGTAYQIPGERPDWDREAVAKEFLFRKKLARFLMDEKALALVEPSPWDRGVVRVMSGGSREKEDPAGVPWLVMAVEHYTMTGDRFPHGGFP